MAKCRFCGSILETTFLDLGMQPLCQDHVKPEELNQMEPHFPLHAYVCSKCFLVQVEEFVAPKGIFNDYAYFSSFSESWLLHANKYSDYVTKRFQLDQKSFISEIASNDGYLLQYFIKKGIPVLGIEPANNVAKFAINKKNVPTEVKFFGSATANYLKNKYGQPDLLIGNNVLAHVPNLNDFVKGMKLFLKKSGVITMEFPHLMKLIKKNEFDTIYHEHFSYFSFSTVKNIFNHHGLEIFDVEELPTHGGSLRIFAKHSKNESYAVASSVSELLEKEKDLRYDDINIYKLFEKNVQETKRKILDQLIKIKREGKTIVGYGAPGKGNTLLNYCGIRTDFLDYTVDKNPAKQNNFLPGTLIPIYSPEKIKETKPDYVMILPWNLKDEIIEQTNFIREWGGKYIIPIPEVSIE